MNIVAPDNKTGMDWEAINRRIADQPFLPGQLTLLREFAAAFFNQPLPEQETQEAAPTADPSAAKLADTA